MMNSGEHPCPRCGEPTYGTWSEGGVKWALCERCMEELSKQGDEAKDEDTQV